MLKPRDWLALAAIAIVFIAIRLPLLHEPALRLGWNSDAAVFGLMARAIYARGEWPLFFWGQSYMGALTSYISAAIALVIGNAGPLALRLASMAEVLAGIVFFWFALRRSFGFRAATASAVLLAIGPAYMLRFVSAPIGAEQMFLLSAVIFWWGVRENSVRQWLVLGLLSGFGWWINQGVVFVIGAVLIVWLLNTEWWTIMWPEPQLLDRLLLRTTRLRWRSVNAATDVLVRTVNALLLVAIVVGVLKSSGFSVPAFFLFDPLLEPVLAWIAFRMIVAAIFSNDVRGGARYLSARWRSWLPQGIAFALGALVAYSPVIIGEWLHLYPERYGLSVAPLQLRALAPQSAVFIRSDFWRLIGADAYPWSIAVAIVLVSALAAALLRSRRAVADLLTARARSYGPRAVAAAAVFVCLLFYLTSERAHPGSERYIVAAVPMLYAFAAEEIDRWGKIAYVLIAAVALALLVPRIEQVSAVTAGKAESYGFAGAFDPRPVIANIERQQYRICYAEYWVAYKLQWVSEERVRFIVFRGYDRRPDLSRALEQTPGPKCFVSGNGDVRRFNAADWNDTTSRAARKRLRQMQ